MGMNITPTATTEGITVDAVKIGCHAGNFCWRSLLAKREITYFINDIK